MISDYKSELNGVKLFESAKIIISTSTYNHNQILRSPYLLLWNIKSGVSFVLLFVIDQLRKGSWDASASFEKKSTFLKLPKKPQGFLNAIFWAS